MILLVPVIEFSPKLTAYYLWNMSTLLRAFQQEEHLEKERRMRDEDRVKRFMNAKNRSIGIDKISLDKQIEEKRLLELAQWEEKLVEGEDVR